MNMPKVSVLMPVRNVQNFICQAIDSVLQQSYIDFELLVIDDGSTDRTTEYIRSYKDPRIRLLVREHNFIENLNEGIHLAHGKYIARMDGDDLMHSERLLVQVQRLEEMPEITVCASWMQSFGENCVSRIMKTYARKIEFPLLALLKQNIFYHPTVMMRKDFLEQHKLEYKAYARAEDYKLWVDIACCGGQFFIEPQVLLFYRISSGQVSAQPGVRLGKKIRYEIMNWLANSALVDRKETRGILERVLTDLLFLEDEGLLSEQDIIQLFEGVWGKINNQLNQQI